MKKKLYMKPEIENFKVQSTQILADSNLHANPANENYGTTDESINNGWN